MTRWFRVFILIGVVGVSPIKTTSAQAGVSDVQALSHSVFDLVSIRPMKQGDDTPTHITNSPHNGYIKAVNVNVKALMEVAYDIPDTRMFGGPGWVTSAKFFLEAKADPKLDEQIARLSPEEGKRLKRKMLAALLEERFKLVVHTETREMPVYAMVLAKGGPKLDGASAKDDSLPVGNDRVDIRSGNDSLEILAYELSWRLGRPVLDRTGLRDRLALTLRWQDEDATAADTNAPSLFTAIQEQLGLKLEATKGPVPVLLDRPRRQAHGELMAAAREFFS